MEVRLGDGAVLSERVGEVRGTADNPITREEVIGTARDLIAPVTGAARCTRPIEAATGIEAMPDIRAPRPLIQA